MALVEAVLTYRAHALGSEGPVPIGATADPRVLRVLRDSLLEAALEEARMWRGVDPGVSAMKAAEAKRLPHVLAVLLPDEDLRPDLRVVPPRDPGDGGSEG